MATRSGRWSVLAAGAMAAILVLTACSPGRDRPEPPAGAPAADAPQFAEIAPEIAPEVAEAARAHLVRWLDGYMGEGVASQDRIWAYRLNRLTPQERPGQGTVYMATFSVRPFSEPSNWWAASGEPGEGGWIENKVQFLRITRDGESYTVERIAAA